MVPPHASSGLIFGDSKVVMTELLKEEENTNLVQTFLVTNALGQKAELRVSLEKDIATFKIQLVKNQYTSVSLKLGGMPIAYGLGDAVSWNTNQKIVKEILQKFQDNGYPIRWAVTGSGFWEEGGTTTSFGKWGAKFLDPVGFKKWMNDKDIKWMIGLRTNLIPNLQNYFQDLRIIRQYTFSENIFL